jgi:hypothetical protein
MRRLVDVVVTDGIRTCRKEEHAEMHNKSKRNGAPLCRARHPHFKSGTKRNGAELILAVIIVIVS